MLVHAYNPQAELKASERLTARLSLRTDAVDDLPYGLLSRLSLKPGRYQLRLSASSSMSGKSGSVYADIDVPDFSKPALSLSGVILEVAQSPLTAPKGRLASLIPIVPSAERDFVAGDTVRAFARIYQGAKAALTPVAATAIVDRTGAEVFSNVETIKTGRFAARQVCRLARLGAGCDVGSRPTPDDGDGDGRLGEGQAGGPVYN